MHHPLHAAYCYPATSSPAGVGGTGVLCAMPGFHGGASSSLFTIDNILAPRPIGSLMPGAHRSPYLHYPGAGGPLAQHPATTHDFLGE